MSDRNVIALPEGAFEHLPDRQPAINAFSLVVGQSAQGKPTEVRDVNLRCTTSKDIEVFLEHQGGVSFTAEFDGPTGTDIARHFGAYWTLLAPGVSTGKSRKGRVTLEKIAFLGTCDIDGETHEVYEGEPEFQGDIPPQPGS